MEEKRGGSDGGGGILLRTFGTTAGIITVAFGALNLVFSVFSPLCILLSLWQILIGFLVVYIEAPCSRVSEFACAKSARAVLERLEERAPYLKSALYICAPCVSIVGCLGLSTIIGNGLIIVTGIFYGFRGKTVRFGLLFLLLLATIFLAAPVALMNVWVQNYGGGLDGTRLARAGSIPHPKLRSFPIKFNAHPTEMLVAFACSGGALLLTCYTDCTPSQKLWLWLLRTTGDVVTPVYVWSAFRTVLDCHDMSGLPHFFSAHSWLGLVTMVLVAVYLLQSIYRAFRALVLLLRGWGGGARATPPSPVDLEGFAEDLGPTKGQSICAAGAFAMLCITSVVGVTQLAFFAMRNATLNVQQEPENAGYINWIRAPVDTWLRQEAFLLNVIGVMLACAAILVPVCLAVGKGSGGPGNSSSKTGRE